VAQTVSEITVRPVLKAVHLVTAAKVHLADKTCTITMGRKVRRPSRVFGKENPMVRPSTAAMRVTASHHGHPTRCAHRIRTGGALETDGPGSKAIKIISINNRIPRKSRHIAIVFIRQNKENIGVVFHTVSPFCLHDTGWLTQQSFLCPQNTGAKQIIEQFRYYPEIKSLSQCILCENG
jgi:hypothetical protein